MFKPHEVTLWFTLMDDNDSDISGFNYYCQLDFLRRILVVDFETLALPENRNWYRNKFLQVFSPLKAAEIIEFYNLNEETK